MTVILQGLKASDVMMGGNLTDVQATQRLYTSVLEEMGDSAGLNVIVVSQLAWLTFGGAFFYFLFRLLEAPLTIKGDAEDPVDPVNVV